MHPDVSCPRCGQPVDSQARNCTKCGVDLAFAAVLVEQVLTAPASDLSKVPLAPEILVPRLGDYLIEKGVIELDSLQQALDYQQEMIAAGEPRLVGQALMDMNLIDRETLDQAITEQILQLQAALQQSNRKLEQRVQERTADLQNALNKLSELNQLKSNFISNISHELRTPLTHLKGYLDLMADGSLGPITEMQSEACSVLMRSEERLEQLIEDLIQFSLAAKGEFSLQLYPLTAQGIMASAILRIEKMAKDKQIKVDLRMPEEDTYINVDGEKITWVISQLLDNALKFTPSGNTIVLQTEIEDGLLTLSVIDSGIGISKEKIPELFEPFHQLDSSNTRRYRGTGLGLALAQRIIEAHGSLIKVTSEQGVGSRFEFSLPTVEGKNGI